MFAIGTLGGTNRTGSSNQFAIIISKRCRAVLDLTIRIVFE